MSHMMSSTSSKQKRLQKFKLAQKKTQAQFGPLTLPAVHPEYLQRRIHLNNLIKFDCDRNISDNIELNDKMSKVYDVPKLKPLINVNDEIAVQCMCEHLSQQVEFAIDTEFDTCHFYHDCIALIQISTHELDFLLDPFKVYPFIKPFLQPVLMNKSILKLVYSQHDILACQRDFDIFFEATVDVQEIVNQYFNSESISYEQNVSLAAAAKVLLGKELSKELQCFQWV